MVLNVINGYPTVGEQAILTRYADNLDNRLADLGVILEAEPSDDSNSGFWHDGQGEPGDP